MKRNSLFGTAGKEKKEKYEAESGEKKKETGKLISTYNLMGRN